MHALKQTIASLLLVAIMAPGAYFAIDFSAPPKQAEAASASCLVGKIYSAILKVTSSVKGALGVPIGANDDGSTADAAGSTISQELKECILDPLMIMMAKALIRQLTASIVDWINSGFEGSPSFVQDPAGFFTDIADETIGEFINSSDLGFLCEPFRLDIRIALAQSYRPYRQRAACTLSQIAGNVEGFIEGNNSGGWDNWLALSTQPQNNPYGAFMEARNEVELRVLGRQNLNLAKLQWGNGFLSWEQCTDTEDSFYSQQDADSYEPGSEEASIAAATAQKQRQCKIMTPGKAIQGQLDNSLSGPLRELELADEFDEIVGALVNQLTKQVFTGIAGLAGVSQRSPSSGGSSYLSDRYYTTVPEAVAAGSADSTFGNIYASSTTGLTDGYGSDVGATTSISTNVAIGKLAEQSSTQGGFGPHLAVDGNLGNIVTNYSFPNIAMTLVESKPYWQVDLGRNFKIEKVVITPRGEGACGDCSPLTNFHVFVSQSSAPTSFDPVVGSAGMVKSALQTKPAPYTDQTTVDFANRVGRFVRIQALDSRALQIAEVRVFGTSASASDAEADLASSPSAPDTILNTGITFTPAFTQGIRLSAQGLAASLFSTRLVAKAGEVKNNLTVRMTLQRVTASGATPVVFSTAFSRLQVSRKERGTFFSPIAVPLSGSSYTIATGSFMNTELDLELDYAGEGPARFTTNFRGQQVPAAIQVGDYRILTEILDAQGGVIQKQSTDFVLQ